MLGYPFIALDNGTYLRLDTTNGPLTGDLGTESLTPTTNSFYNLGSDSFHWLRFWSDHAEIVRVAGAGTLASNIGLRSSALGCTVLAVATAAATLDAGNLAGSVTTNLAAAAWAAFPGDTATIEMLGTSGTNFGSAVTIQGPGAATGRITFINGASGSMNFGSCLPESTTPAIISIEGDGVFNFGNCRTDGGTITLSGATSVNFGTLLGGTLTIGGESSFNMGTVEGGATMTIGGDGSYNLARIGVGTLNIAGDGCFNVGAIEDSGSTITLSGNKAQSLMSVTGGADVSVSGGTVSTFCRGLATAAATIALTASGTSVLGYYLGRAVTNVTASAVGASITGTVDLTAATSTPGTVTMTANAIGANILGTIATAAAGLGASTMTAGGVGASLFGAISLEGTATATMNSSGVGSLTAGACLSGSISTTGDGGFTQAYTSGGGTVLVSGLAAKAITACTITGTGTAAVTSSGTGNVVIGYCRILSGAAATAALTTGVAVGSILIGTVSGGGGVDTTIRSSAQGSIVIAYAARSGATPSLVEATATAAIIIGAANAGTLSATQTGAYVRAYVTGGGTVTSTNSGAEASGRCIGGTITSGGLASLATGYAPTSTTISSTGNASIAQGDATGGNISATVANAIQFGPGTNSVVSSLQVGDSAGGTGVWLLGGGVPGAPVNGQLWKTVTTNRMTIQSAGQTINLYRQSAYTLTYATATTTHAARTAVTLTGNAGGTGNTAMVAVPDPADTPITADALRDDLVANVLPVIRDDLDDLRLQLNALKVDADNTAQLLNQLILDFRVINLVS